MAYSGTVIDMHTHIFNAHCVPLNGVLRQKGVPFPFNWALASLFNLLTGKLDFHENRGEEGFQQLVLAFDGSVDSLEVIGDALASIAATELTIRFYTKGFSKYYQLKNRALLETKLRSDELYNLLERIEEMAIADGSIVRTGPSFPSLKQIEMADESISFKITQSYFVNRFKSPILWILRKLLFFLPDDSYATAAGYVTFFLMMLSKIKTLAHQVLKQYRHNQSVTAAIHLMMDMQHPFGDEEPTLEFKEQIAVTAEAVAAYNNGNHSGKKILGFVAFDPNRDDQNGMDCLKEGFAQGNVGVKVYPPMGYTAVGNADPDLQRRLFRLYDNCIKNDRPILTHCTPEGFEAYDGSGLLSNPVHWQEVLGSKGNNYERLRLCYGHAGGIGKNSEYPGWGAAGELWESPNNFARMVVEHCRTYPNVYCDMSHYEAIMKGDEIKKTFVKNFVRELKDKSGDYLFRKKAMYGSDWHMPEMAQRTRQYLDLFRELFSKAAIKDYAEDFFYKNALKFLNLEKRVSIQRLLHTGPLSLSSKVTGGFQLFGQVK